MQFLNSWLPPSLRNWWQKTRFCAFIHARRFPSEKALISHIQELSEAPGAPGAHHQPTPRASDPTGVQQKAEQVLIDFFSRIFERSPGVINRNRYQRVRSAHSRFYGHGFFRTVRRISRYLRGKK